MCLFCSLSVRHTVYTNDWLISWKSMCVDSVILLWYFFHMYAQLLSLVWLFETLWTSPPGSSVHGISQARTLEWVAISFFRGSSWSRDQPCRSCIGRWILYHWATQEAMIILEDIQICIFPLFSKQFSDIFLPNKLLNFSVSILSLTSV